MIRVRETAVIEAVPFIVGEPMADVTQFFAGAHHSVCPPETFLFAVLSTDERDHKVERGDWILTFPDGARTVASTEEFQRRYEPIRL